MLLQAIAVSMLPDRRDSRSHLLSKLIDPRLNMILLWNAVTHIIENHVPTDTEQSVSMMRILKNGWCPVITINDHQIPLFGDNSPLVDHHSIAPEAAEKRVAEVADDQDLVFPRRQIVCRANIGSIYELLSRPRVSQPWINGKCA